MDSKTMILVVVVVAILVIAAVAFVMTRRRKSEHLKQQFGPEYDRAVKQHGDPRHAEAVLAEREKRVEAFSLRPLEPADRDRYVADWSDVQRRFVDDPSAAVTQADKLVTTVMGARGYPVGDFEQRAADISVHYPAVVQNYRAARQVNLLNQQGKATTEDLRNAMVYFRSLFDELLQSPKPHAVGDPNARLAS